MKDTRPETSRQTEALGSPEISFQSVVNHGLAAAADLLTRGFEDYFVRLQFTPARLLEMVRVDSVDLTASRVIRVGGEAIGIGLISRRGWTCRLAGMALLPPARRRGFGRRLVRQLMDEGRARGDREMVLEAIEQNDPAVRLYTACGFTKVRRLVGFLGQASGAPLPAPEIAAVDLRTAAWAVARSGPENLPWQLSAETLAQLTPPSFAFATPEAWLICTPAAETQMVIRGLVSVASDDKERAARELLAAVMAQHPGISWRMNPVWPEEQAGFFLR